MIDIPFLKGLDPLAIVSREGSSHTIIRWNIPPGIQGVSGVLRFTIHEKNVGVFDYSLQVLFPEIDKLFGIPQPEKHHPEIDCGLHAILSLKAACHLSQDPHIRFASLVHDLGKACTPKSNWPSHHNHEKLGLAP